MYYHFLPLHCHAPPTQARGRAADTAAATQGTSHRDAAPYQCTTTSLSLYCHAPPTQARSRAAGTAAATQGTSHRDAAPYQFITNSLFPYCMHHQRRQEAELEIQQLRLRAQATADALNSKLRGIELQVRVARITDLTSCDSRHKPQQTH